MMNYQKKKEVYFFISYIGNFWDDSLIAWMAKFSSLWLVVHRTISIKIKLTKIQCVLDIHSTKVPTLETLFYNAVDSKGYFFQLMDIPHIALVLFIYWIQGLLQGGF